MNAASGPDSQGQDLAEPIDDIIPSHGYAKVPVVGLGGSAGSIEALQAFFATVPRNCAVAFVVVIHLSPTHESVLADIIQRSTRMPVVRVDGVLKLEAGTVYVIPPGHTLQACDGELCLGDIPEGAGKHVVVDVFFRTLGDSHGAHAAAVVLSGLDGDGAIGIKHIKERGGLTVVQDPEQAAHGSMPRASIATGLVDWILPVQEMPARLLAYFRLEVNVALPPEDGPAAGQSPGQKEEAQLRDVLTFLHTRTGRDFTDYKRGTVLRRIGRRMQVNGIDNLGGYVNCLRTRPGESAALVQDLLISVTSFFRDPEGFAALEACIPALFEGKGPNDVVRAWVMACATGEEAYSVAMLLVEHAQRLPAPPMIQVFATDLADAAIRTARDGDYPPTIAAAIGEERLHRFFHKEHRGYRVRRELRERVLFAVHDVLHDAPFSRLDLVTCRNLLIYLSREAQARIFHTMHTALLPGGKVFLGSSESMDDSNPLFVVVDKKHRLYAQRPVSRTGWTLPPASATLTTTLRTAHRRPAASAYAAPEPGGIDALAAPEAGRDGLRAGHWGEVQLQLLERLGPPSVLIDSEYDMLHLSPGAGRYLQFAGGEPSRNLLRSVQAELRIELRAALFQASQGTPVDLPPMPLDVGDVTALTVVRVIPMRHAGDALFLVLFDVQVEAGESGDERATRLKSDPLARHLDAEIERLKSQLRDTVEQYEASTEELKASNEELQAMNEEMRSAAEELETSQEELQSINEELTTVNQELKGRVDQLSSANSDMQNLMDATQIATIFLDRERRIMRYTPAAIGLFNLIPGDLGRPLTDMATHLDYPELDGDAAQVLQRLIPVEREVRQGAGNWYLARLMPYRTPEDRIAGIVITFIDITERKEGEEVRLWLSAMVSATPDGIISFAPDQTILSWNAGAQRLYGYSAEEAIGRPLAMLAIAPSGEQAHIAAEVNAGRSIDNLETVFRHKDGGEMHVALTVSPIKDDSGKVLAGTAIARDISALRKATEALRQSEERLRLVAGNAPASASSPPK